MTYFSQKIKKRKKTKRAPRSRSPPVVNKTGVLLSYVCSSIFLTGNVISAIF